MSTLPGAFDVLDTKTATFYRKYGITAVQYDRDIHASQFTAFDQKCTVTMSPNGLARLIEEHSEAIRILRQEGEDHELIERVPAVKKAFEEYQLLAKLTQGYQE